MTIAQRLQTLAADELQQRVGGLVEQPFYGARTSYGDELRLSFGTSNEPTGRWRLGTRTAKWILLGEVGVLARDTDGPEGLRAFAALGDTRIAAVDVTRSDRTLTLVFDAGHRFVVLPNKPQGRP